MLTHPDGRTHEPSLKMDDSQSDKVQSVRTVDILISFDGLPLVESCSFGHCSGGEHEQWLNSTKKTEHERVMFVARGSSYPRRSK